MLVGRIIVSIVVVLWKKESPITLFSKVISLKSNVFRAIAFIFKRSISVLLIFPVSFREVMSGNTVSGIRVLSEPGVVTL